MIDISNKDLETIGGNRNKNVDRTHAKKDMMFRFIVAVALSCQRHHHSSKI